MNPVDHSGSSYNRIWLLRMETLLMRRAMLRKKRCGEDEEITPEPPTSILSRIATSCRLSLHPGEEPPSRLGLQNKDDPMPNMRWEM